jgi:hypothetical protein
LTSVTNLRTTPQRINDYIFSNTTLKNVMLKVPESAVNTYKAAYYWRDFKNIVGI